MMKLCTCIEKAKRKGQHHTFNIDSVQKGSTTVERRHWQWLATQNDN